MRTAEKYPRPPNTTYRAALRDYMQHDILLLEHQPEKKAYFGRFSGRCYDYACERSQRFAIQFGEAREIKHRQTFRPLAVLGTGPIVPELGQ